MKKIIMATAFLAALFTLSCCNNSKELKTVKYTDGKQVALTDSCPDSLKMSFDIEYPVGGAPAAAIKLMNSSIIETAFGNDYDTLSVQDAVTKFMAYKEDDYKTANLDLWKTLQENGEAEMSASLNWEGKISGTFTGKYKDFLSYSVINASYEGGAHGMETETSINFNSKTGEVVTEDKFFTPDYNARLSSLLSSHLRESMKDQESYDMLFIKDIEPNGNFQVSENGVTYIYQPYEIGPYALGTIKVTIPWEELGDLVTGNTTEEETQK
jgi:hypothetical protein